MICEIFHSVESFRNILAFWIFGVTSNFAFTVSIGAAEDIIETNQDFDSASSDNQSSFENLPANQTHVPQNRLICNSMGTGAILLSAILPEIVVKLGVQFSPKEIPYTIRFLLTLIFQSIGFVLLAVGNTVWLRILGVTSASIATGLGESTFLPLTAFYYKETITAWSFGTGTAGVLGTLSYAGFTSLGVPVDVLLLSMLVVPAMMLFTYIWILKISSNDVDILSETKPFSLDEKEKKQNGKLTLKEKVTNAPEVIKYFLSLGAAYLIVYVVNQGLAELLYFKHQFISRLGQYRWYQFLYRIGAFISRLPINKVKVTILWLLPSLLLSILCILVVQVFVRFIPNMWIIMTLIFMNGIIHGTCYICTFMNVTEHIDSGLKEFALGIVSLSGPVGLVLAGFISVPFHNFVCSLDIKI